MTCWKPPRATNWERIGSYPPAVASPPNALQRSKHMGRFRLANEPDAEILESLDEDAFLGYGCALK